MEQDPIYEDILDLKKPSNATVTSGGAPVKNNKPSSHEVRKKSSVQYGVITAKELMVRVVHNQFLNVRVHFAEGLVVEFGGEFPLQVLRQAKQLHL